MEPIPTGELRIANGCLSDPDQLRARLDEDGYLYFTGVLNRAAIRTTRTEVLRVLIEQKLAHPSLLEPVWAGPVTAEFMEHHEGPLQRRLGELRLWENLVACPPIEVFFARLTGGPTAFIPLARYRVAPPGGLTAIHRDVTLNPGFNMVTAWIPLMRTDLTLGVLPSCRAAIAKGLCTRGWQRRRSVSGLCRANPFADPARSMAAGLVQAG